MPLKKKIRYRKEKLDGGEIVELQKPVRKRQQLDPKSALTKMSEVTEWRDRIVHGLLFTDYMDHPENDYVQDNNQDYKLDLYTLNCCIRITRESGRALNDLAYAIDPASTGITWRSGA